MATQPITRYADLTPKQLNELPSKRAGKYTQEALGKLADPLTGGVIDRIQHHPTNPILPHVPIEALAVFICGGERNDDNAETSSDLEFHEIDEWQTTAGATVRAPNGTLLSQAPRPLYDSQGRTTRGNNTWGRLGAPAALTGPGAAVARDVAVQTQLGGSAPMDPGCWRDPRNNLAVHVIGMRGLECDYAAGIRALPEWYAEGLDAKTPDGTALSVWIMFAAFSGGPGKLPLIIAELVQRRLLIPRGHAIGERLWATRKGLAAAIVAGWSGATPGNTSPRPDRHSNPIHTALRTEQKMYGTAALMRSTHREGWGAAPMTTPFDAVGSPTWERLWMAGNWRVTPAEADAVGLCGAWL